MSDAPKPRAGADDAIAKIVTKDWFRAIAPKTIPRMHKAMNRLTRGRFVPGAGLVLYTIGSKTVPAAELTLLSLAEVVLAPLWVWLAIGEVPTHYTMIGGAILLLAIAGNALLGARQKTPITTP